MFFQRLQAFSLLVAFNVNLQATLSFYSNRRQPFNQPDKWPTPNVQINPRCEQF